jgi:hypothetical protein
MLVQSHKQLQYQYFKKDITNLQVLLFRGDKHDDADEQHNAPRQGPILQRGASLNDWLLRSQWTLSRWMGESSLHWCLSHILSTSKDLAWFDLNEWCFLAHAKFQTSKDTLQSLQNLRVLDFQHCSGARLNLGALTTLRDLDLSHSECGTSRVIDFSGSDVPHEVMSLRLSGCWSPQSLIGLERLTQLVRLDVSYTTLADPLNLDCLKTLTELNISWSRIEELPGLSSLTRLTYLDVSHTKLHQLLGIGSLTALRHLDASGCKMLTVSTTPTGLTKLELLEHLDLAHTELLILPDISEMAALSYLDLRGCLWLSPKFLECHLKEFVRYCRASNIELYGPPGPPTPKLHLHRLPSLNRLYVHQYNYFDMNGHAADCTVVSELYISHCSELTNTEGMSELVNLIELRVNHCSKITELQGLSALCNLTVLHIDHCSSLTELPRLDRLLKLEDLRVMNCTALTELPAIVSVDTLQTLDLSYCGKLAKMNNDLTEFKALHQLYVIKRGMFGIYDAERRLQVLHTLQQREGFHYTNFIGKEYKTVDNKFEWREYDVQGLGGIDAR